MPDKLQTKCHRLSRSRGWRSHRPDYTAVVLVLAFLFCLSVWSLTFVLSWIFLFRSNRGCLLTGLDSILCAAAEEPLRTEAEGGLLRVLCSGVSRERQGELSNCC